MAKNDPIVTVTLPSCVPQQLNRVPACSWQVMQQSMQDVIVNVTNIVIVVNIVIVIDIVCLSVLLYWCWSPSLLRGRCLLLPRGVSGVLSHHHHLLHHPHHVLALVKMC